MVSPLLNASTEIICSIFASLDSSDLDQLCLVNADPHALAEPISVRPGDHHQYRRESPKLVVAEDDMDAAIECIKDIDVPFGKAWIQGIRSKTMDAFVALLLSRLMRLKCLYTGENFTRESRLVGKMLRAALCEQHANLPRFEHIEDASAVYFSLGIDIRKYTDARITADVLSLFYLSSVKSITASIDNTDNFTWLGAKPPSPSRLESLDLAMIREDHFVTDVIHLDQIAADLSHVRGTLTDLTIYAGTDMSRAEPEFPPVQIEGNSNVFSALDVLEKLEVPLPFLLGFSPSDSDTIRLGERLPTSIQFLTITDDLYLQEEWAWRDTEVLQVIRLWLQDWRNLTPHLRKFHLLLKELQDLGTEAEIEVEITKLAGSM
ncbi:hypothetical protein EDB81DRAFT_864382 [Dactylonectria macrodidyma]|uniref:F-box domain-containing protein n=1 Tax=Dactylonectria macrodidyma TaxID=307937 RepID=A0A9P9JJR9_9HYPO|nr:hypothetical protein EDB81DRAFT_864382 [Dactylonectria macrodidyma]